MRFFKVMKSRNGKMINLNEIKPKINEVCQKFNIILLYLFGSYATGEAYGLSDLDIGFFPYKKFDLDKVLSLSSKLQDIFEEEAIDLVDLSRAPITLIHRVIKEGRCLYGKDLRRKIEFEIKNEAFYYDTEPLRKEYFGALERRIIDGTFGYR